MAKVRPKNSRSFSGDAIGSWRHIEEEVCFLYVSWIGTRGLDGPRRAPPLRMRLRCWYEVVIGAEKVGRIVLREEGLRGDDAPTTSRAIRRWCELEGIRRYKDGFRVLVGYGGRSMRAESCTQGAGTGIGIYWLNGERIATSYSDLYDGSWSSQDVRNEHGALRGSVEVWTGTNNTGGAPAVTAVALTSAPRADATYRAGERIEVSVTFSAPVTVTGTPRIELKVGTNTVEVPYARHAGPALLVFGYTVPSGAMDGCGSGMENPSH